MRQAEIEKHLFHRERDLLNIPATITFYDLTNTYCTGQHDDQGLRRFGRSKQRRNDCPLVTLALVLDEMGFPRSSEILPGNVGEAKTPKAALESLEEVHGCRDSNNRPTVVMDAGIATDDNLRLLKEKGYDWICISRGVRKALPEGVIPIWTPFLVWHILSRIETFATVEAMSESRIFEDLPIIICSNFGWIPVLF